MLTFAEEIILLLLNDDDGPFRARSECFSGLCVGRWCADGFWRWKIGSTLTWRGWC